MATLHDYTLHAASTTGRRRRRACASIASPMPPRTSSPIRSRPPIRGCRPRSTGTRRSPTGAYLWSLGFGVAEAMDTAQRGMGLDWPTSLELIDRSLALARATPGAVIACGAGTDHLEPRATHDDRRRDRRLRAAMRSDRKPRRPHHPDGEPRARRVREVARRLREGLRAHPVAGARAGDPALAGRHVRSGARRLLGSRRRRSRDGRLPRCDPVAMSPRSTASRSRCSTRTRKSRCAGACRGRAHVSPATISISPN